MEIIFLASFVASLLVFSVVLNYFVRHYREDKIKRVIWYIFLVGFLYLIVSIFSVFWFFSIVEYVKEDFLFIYSLIILLQSLFLFMIVYFVTQNKRFFYLLISYVLVFFLAFLLGISYMNFFLLSSFLFMLILFIGLVLEEFGFRRSGYLGILYAVVSLVLHILFFAGVFDLAYEVFFSGIFFLLFIFYFLKNLEESPPEISLSKNKKRGYFFVFLSHFIFMLVLINFVFIGTVVVHEFGHLSVSSFYGCEYGKIVYDGTFPKTEILCPDDNSHMKVILLGALLFPIVIALFLILVRGKFLKEIGLLMIGFNLVVSSKDFSALGFTDNLIMFFVILGIFMSVAGIVLLARSKTEEYIYSLSNL